MTKYFHPWLGLAACVPYYDLYVHQMDVKITFSYHHLHEEIYMAQLEGYVDPKYRKNYSNAYLV
jgi:hypothetical protein